MKKSVISKRLDCLKKMPPLLHSFGDSFDINKSACVAWMLMQPDLKQFLFDKAVASGYIQYDKETGKWAGVDFQVGECK